MQLTLADLRLRVRAGLGEPPNSSRLTTTDLDSAINQAYADVVRDGRCFRRTTSGTGALAEVKTVASQKVYSLPDDICDFLSVYLEGGTSPLNRCTQEDLDASQGLWQTTDNVLIAAVTHVYDAGHGKIGIWPPTSVADKAIIITGHCVPTGTSGIGALGGFATLSATTDKPAIDSYFHEMIEWRAMEKLAATKLLDSETAAQRAAWAAGKYSRLMPLLVLYPRWKAGLLDEHTYLNALAAALTDGK